MLDNAYGISYVYWTNLQTHESNTMPIFTVTEARTNLYRLVDDTAQSHEPIIIQGKRSKAVLISEDDWRAMEETLHLLGIPGMRESIRLGLNTPVDECSDEPGW